MSKTAKTDQITKLVGRIEEVRDDISDLKAFDIPVLIIFCILFIIVALQFFTRYVLNDSLGWTEEIARYFLIMLGFCGSITCVRKGKHIFLEFAYHHLPTQSIKPIILLAEAVVLFFWGYAGWLAIELAQKTRANMVSIAIPKAYLYYFVATCCFFMVLFAALNCIRQARKSAQVVASEKIKQADEKM